MARRVWMMVVALGLLLRPALAAENQPAARAEIGKPVQQAQALIRQRKYAEALQELKRADAVGNKSPYETYVIEESRAAAMAGAADYPGAIKALEAVLATHFLPPADALKRLETIVRLDYQIKDYPKTVDAAARYYKDGGADPEPRQLMAQSYYLDKDYADAAKTLRDLLAKGPPDETLLLTLANSELQLKDEAGYVDALERLVEAHPKRDYWVDLCRAVAQKPGFAPRLTLDLDRIEVAAGAMTASDQYVEAAELALEDGFPGDAATFLAKGNEAGILGTGAGADRQKRLAGMAKTQSDTDQKGLAQQQKEAQGAKTGIAEEKLGEAYLSYGRYPEAIAALEGSLAKGGLDHPDDARLHLGIAYLRGGQSQKAQATLDPIKGTDGDADLARLWLITGNK
ncbi:MAG TPA: tetratricopeptide repeat protein [Stellaceae bacterium]|nr:tetratricopeptide repeat protein [Stellaceae bacterium]